jgi:hypothetical protein
MERFSPRNLNEGEFKEKYPVTIKNEFETLTNVEDNGDINRVWDTIR